MSHGALQVIRWTSDQPPSELAIRQILADEDLRPYLWSNAPGDVYSPHTHGYHKVLYVVRGAITMGLPGEGRQVTLEAGDRLELPQDTVHDARVGPEGVVCLEAHRPAYQRS